MARDAILQVRILGDASGAQRAMGDAGSAVDNLESSFSKLALPAGIAFGAVVLGGKQAYDAASRLEQAMGAVDSVFGDNASTVKGWADTASTSVGLSKSAYGEMASVIGAQLNNLTGNADTALSGTQNLIGLGADLAATFGGTTTDAVGALSAALRGEADPAERYGLSLNQTAVNAYLASKGLSGLQGDALTAAKAQAVMDLATQQAGGALGQFTRESDTAAGSAQIAGAQFEDAKASLGEALLPAAASVTKELGNLAKAAGDNPQVFMAIAGAIGAVSGAVLAVNGAFKVYRTGQDAVNAGRTVWSGVATQVGRMRDGFNSAGAAASKFSGTAGTLGGALRKVTDATTSGVKAAARWIASQARAAAAGAKNIAMLVAQKVAQIAGAVATGIATAAVNLWNIAVAIATSPITLIIIAILAVIAVFVLLWVKVKGFRDFFINIWNGILAVFSVVWNAIKTIVGVVITVITAYVKIWLAIVLVAWELIKIGAAAVWSFIVDVWNGIRAAAATVFNWLLGIAATVWAFLVGVWEGIRNAATAAWNWIWTNAIQPVFNFLMNIAATVWAFVVGAWEGIRNAASTAWNWVVNNVVQPVMDRIKNAVQTARDVINNVWETIKTAGSNIWEGIKSAANTALDPIKTAINKVKDAFDAVKSAVQNVIDILGRIKVPDVVDKISGWLGIGGRSAAIPEGAYPYAALGRSFPAALTEYGARTLTPRLSNLSADAINRQLAGVTVVVNGALDPVAVARQIRVMLRDDDRRHSGVRLAAVT
jgi:phage-related protein